MPRDLGIVEETLFRKLDRSGTLGRGDRYTGNEKIDKFAKEWNDLRPGWNEFLKQEIYTKEQINEDKRKVESIKNSPDYIKERSEKAVALEYILMEIINSNNALGEGVNVYPASEFDDFVNSTDFVVRFPGEQEGEFFYLAVDATISDDPTVIDNKLKRSTYGLRNNNLPELKYFIDEERDKPVKGKISMPKVVINISDNKLNRVIDSFTADRTYAFDDALRQEIIDEIKKQLEKNAKYLLSNFYSEMAESKIKSEGLTNYILMNKKEIERNKQLDSNVGKYLGVTSYLEKVKNLVPDKL